MINPSAEAATHQNEALAAAEYGVTIPARLPTQAVAIMPESRNSSLATTALIKAIDRLEDVLDVETESLRTGKATASLDEFNYRKSHGLLELTRAVRGIDPATVDGSVRTRLTGLRQKLENNQTLLKTHLDAAREISGILTAAIRQAESDGTYSAPSVTGRAQ